MNSDSLRVYADHHATTPMRPEVFEAMRPWLTGLTANPSSVHAEGRRARQAVEEARAAVARAISARSDEIILTAGGTEADNLALAGAARALAEKDPKRRRLLVSAAEHAAVREGAKSILSQGFTLEELPLGPEGVPANADVVARLGADVAVVSLILATNETGAIHCGVPALAEAVHGVGAVLHTDAVQAVGKIPVSVEALGVDLLSLAAHKFGGPKGAGALYVRKGTRLWPLLVGGSQERGRRAGTENVAALVGLGVAIERAASILEEERVRLAALRDSFETRLAAALPGVRFNGRDTFAERLPTVSSVTFPGAEGETLLFALDLEGVAVSAGSACSAGSMSVSRTLLASGVSEEDARSTLRFSFGWSSTPGDVDALLALIPRVVAQVAGSSLATPAPAISAQA
ncbi:MAG: cysteine desulfurase [Acidobacteria bacterium]|nr:cysteine desulfurase [Acidobacteriota bacterium]